MPFSQSRLSNQFLTFEDGGELISFTTWAWVWRGIGIVDAFIIPSTCIRERDIVIAPLVSLVVKTLVYQPMDRGLNPDEGKFFHFYFFQKNAKISECIYAYLAW